jgi:hypothetical protein
VGVVIRPINFADAAERVEHDTIMKLVKRILAAKRVDVGARALRLAGVIVGVRVVPPSEGISEGIKNTSAPPRLITAFTCRNIDSFPSLKRVPGLRENTASNWA